MRFRPNYLLSMVDVTTGQRSLLRRFWFYRNAKKARDLMVAEHYGKVSNTSPRFRFNIYRHLDY